MKQLALTYAIKFTGKWMLNKFSDLEGNNDSGDKRVKNWVIENIEALPEIAATSSGLKALCTYLTSQGIEDCRKCCGGNGYLHSAGLASLAADYVWQTTAEGDWVILMLQTANFLMKTASSARSGIAVSGPVDYLAPLKNKDFDVSQLAPRPARSMDDFQNLDYITQLFKFSALNCVLAAEKTYKSHLAPDNSNHDEAWNSCSIELLNCVRAHCFYFLYISFVAQIQKITDPSVKDALTKVCCLFACSNMMDEPHWTGLLTMEQMQLIKRTAAKLLDDIRPNAVALVDAWDIPDRVLNSAIGRYDGNVYEALYDSVKKNPLNHTDPFVGYEEELRPYLDLELLKQGNNVPKAKL